MIGKIAGIYQRYAARRMFQRWSPIYEEEVEDNAYSAADAVAAEALRLLDDTDGKNPQIADIGIGTGLAAEKIKAAMPCHIAGIDFTEDMMALCAQKACADILVKCDAGKDEWPFEDGAFDMIVSAGLFEYLTQEMGRHFLSEAARVLKPGGFVVFAYIPSEKKNRNTTEIWPGHTGRFLRCSYDPGWLQQNCGKNGFGIVAHSKPFAGSVFQDGSSYPYRMMTVQKIQAPSLQA